MRYFETRFLEEAMNFISTFDPRTIQQTMVIATHGFIKKTDKIPAKEISKAIRIKNAYFGNIKNK